MLLRVVYSFAIILLLSGCVVKYEKDPVYGFSHQRLGKISVDSVEARGPLTLSGTEVFSSVSVRGALVGEDAKMDSLDVVGEADLVGCTVSGKAHVEGVFVASGCTFSELEVVTDEVTLWGCCLGSLHVVDKGIKDAEVGSSPSCCIVDLREGSTVSGMIVVDAPLAEVWVSSASDIREDQVQGAVLKLPS